MKVKKNLAVLLSAGIFISCMGAGTVTADADYESEEEQLFQLINEARKQSGLGVFQTTPLLQKAADARVQETLTCFSSNRPNGKAGSSIMNEYGIEYDAGVCCVVGDCSSIEHMYTYLMSQTSEKRKMLSNGYDYIGIGITKSSEELYYGALLFANNANETAVLGDVEKDGDVNILDVITVNKACLGKETLSELQLYCADVNQNGVPDSGDALEMLKYIVGLKEALSS